MTPEFVKKNKRGRDCEMTYVIMLWIVKTVVRKDERPEVILRHSSEMKECTVTVALRSPNHWYLSAQCDTISTGNRGLDF